MKPIYIDTETTGFDPYINKITLIQILQNDKIHLIQKLIPEKILEIKNILENNIIVGHNLKFDLKFLKHQYGIECLNIFDTYIAELVLSGGSKARTKGAATLEAVALKYTGIQLKKDQEVRTSFTNKTLTPEQIEYAAMDVAVLPEIYTKQQKELERLNLLNTFQIEMKCLPAVIWLELSGLPIDLEKLAQLKISTQIKINDAEEKIKKIFLEAGYKKMSLFGEEAISVNLNSPKDLLKTVSR